MFWNLQSSERIRSGRAKAELPCRRLIVMHQTETATERRTHLGNMHKRVLNIDIAKFGINRAREREMLARLRQIAGIERQLPDVMLREYHATP